MPDRAPQEGGVRDVPLRRRWRLSWALAGAALLAVLVLLIDRRSSVRAMDESAQRYEDAQEAFRGLLMGIHPELDRVQDIELIARSGERALAVAESGPAAERTDEDREFLARLLLWNGEAQRLAGDPERAAEHFERATVEARLVDDAAVAAEIEIRAETALGELARRGRRVAEAREHFRRAIEVGGRRIEAGEADRDHRIAHVRALVRYGDLSLSAAGPSAVTALEVFGRARAALDDPEAGFGKRDRDVLELRAELDMYEANAAFKAGERSTATKLMRSHLRHARRLAELDPGLPARREAIGRGARALAQVQRANGEYKAAVESLRTSVEQWNLLREMEPSVPTWRRHWARTTRQLANALASVGEWQEAARLHDVSLLEFESMLADGEVPPAARIEVGAQLLDAAEGLLAAGDVTSARRSCGRAVKRIGDEPEGARARREWSAASARASVLRAEILLAEGDWDAAESRAYRFIESARELSAEVGDRAIRAELARALLVGSAVHAMRGKAKVARSARERALALIDELLEESPKDGDTLALRAQTLFVLGKDKAASKTIERLDEMGYRDLRLGAIRAATARYRR